MSARHSEAEKEAEQFPLSEKVERFDSAAMKNHSQELEYAGRLLEQTYSTSLVISTIAGLVRRSQINAEVFLSEDLTAPRLQPIQEDALLSAIELLAGGLSDEMDRAAEHLGKVLKKGGK